NQVVQKVPLSQPLQPAFLTAFSKCGGRLCDLLELPARQRPGLFRPEHGRSANRTTQRLEVAVELPANKTPRLWVSFRGSPENSNFHREFFEHAMEPRPSYTNDGSWRRVMMGSDRLQRCHD